MPVFHETVQEAWSKPVNTQDAILRIHVKLLRTVKALRHWRRNSLAGWKLRWAIINMILANLERAKESTTLQPEELQNSILNLVNL